MSRTMKGKQWPVIEAKIQRAGTAARVSHWRDDAWNELLALVHECGDKNLFRTRDTLRALRKAVRA